MVEMFINENNCSICLDELEDTQKIKKLECNHLFHEKCIEEWAKVSGKTEECVMTWTCPICRENNTEQVIYDNNIHYLTLVTFKTNRLFIQIVTFSDFIVAAYMTLSGNFISFFYCICSLYGFNGATNFNINHLNSYAYFCFLTFFIRLIELSSILYMSTYTNKNTIAIQKILNNHFFMIMFFITTFLQLYMFIIITRMCNDIREYGDRLRYMINA